MVKPGVRPDILAHVERSKESISYEGAQVLEIGGDRWQASAELMLESGAKHVTTINITPNWPEHEAVSPNLTKIKANANELTAHFEENQFDVCYGIAVLEHISELWLMLDELQKVLKPGGHAYLHGGPIWTSAKGHHIFTKFEDQWYRFSDPDCAIGNWEHLMYDEAELTKRIRKRGHSAKVARYLANWVFSSDEQNRYGYKQLADIFEKSPLGIVTKYDNAFKGPDKKGLKLIAKGPWSNEGEFNVMGVTYVLKKDD